MAVNIVTGCTGTDHITSDDFRAMNASIFGTGKYVLDYGNKFDPTIVTNNQIRIRDGMCINQGTQMGIELTDYEDVAIENGVSGSNRNDLIVMRYERNADSSIESASLVVIKGTAGSSSDPSYNSGNILDGGELIDDMPLYRVKIESLSIIAVEPLFSIFTEDDRKKLSGLSNVDNTSDLNKPVSIATQKAIDDIEIGGRNLLVGTKDFNITNALSITGSLSTIVGEYNGLTVRYRNEQWNFYKPEISLKAGTYTFSAYAKGSGRAQLTTNKSASKVISITSDWSRYFYTFTIKEDSNVILMFETVNSNSEIYECGWKLEKGNKATDWTPAPEDFDADIQSVENQVTTNLLKPTLATTTQNVITCTNNGDGTYTLNGTASANTSFYFISSKNALGLSNFAGKKLKLLGNPVIGDTNCRLVAVNSSWGTDATDVGNGSVFTLAENTKLLYIDIKSGFTCDNLVFKPMITTNLNATYDDFVPYTGSTGQLNSDVAEIVNNLGDASYKGVSTSVLSGDTNLVTGGAVSEAIYTATNYEEGTWTPRLFTATSSGSWSEVSITDKSGYYRISGDVVVLSACMSSVSLSSKTYMKITGLPFSIGNVSFSGSSIIATLQESTIGSIGGTTGVKPSATPVMASCASGSEIIFQKASASGVLSFEAIYHKA